MLTDMFKSEKGRILLSIILGFGLATMFRKACMGAECIVVQGPPMKEIRAHTYRIDDECYKYTPVVTKCT